MEWKRQGRADGDRLLSRQGGRGLSISDSGNGATNDARDALIQRHLGLVTHIVSRMSEICAPGRLEKEDAYSYGVAGLIQAIDAYDPSRGASFSTFAVPRIRGAILDAARRADPLPRSVRRQIREIEIALVELTQWLGRWPTNNELALRTGILPHEIQRIRLLASASVTSLDAASEGALDDSLAIGFENESNDPEAAVDRFGTRQALCSSMSRLAPRDRRVIELYYVRSLTFREIAEILHLSESRVSQLHRRVIMELRTSMRNELNAA